MFNIELMLSFLWNNIFYTKNYILYIMIKQHINLIFNNYFYVKNIIQKYLF